MKHRVVYLIILMVIFSLKGFSQEQTSGTKSNSSSSSDQQEFRTLFGHKDGKVDHGGWGGFTVGYTRISGKDAILSGGRGGWLINHRFTLGLAGYGFYTFPENNGQYQPTYDNYYLGGGYGGLLVEPIIAPFSPVHISIPILIGGGGAFVIDDMMYHGYNNYGSYGGCFVLEPGLDIEFNVVKFFRVALNVSYRYTSYLSLDYYSDTGVREFSVLPDAMRGFSAGLTLKFGKF